MNHLKMVTVENINERLEHQCRLELAGISRPELSLGPAVFLWMKHRPDTEGIEAETWEVLPEWVAEFLVANIVHDEPDVARACIYHRFPKNAPMDVAARWLRARLEALQR